MIFTIHEPYSLINLFSQNTQVLLLNWADDLMPENPGYDFLEIFAGKQSCTRAWYLS